MKSWWWGQQEKKEKRMWCSQEYKLLAIYIRRKDKRRVHMEREDHRVVVRGWSHWVQPKQSIGLIGAMKADVVYRRNDGRQGTVTVSFGTASEAKSR